MTRHLVAVALLAVVAGCSKSRPDASATSATASAAQAPVALSGAEAETQLGDDLAPTEADFEEEAERKLVAQNLEAELDQLEKEIDTPTP